MTLIIIIVLVGLFIYYVFGSKSTNSQSSVAATPVEFQAAAPAATVKQENEPSKTNYSVEQSDTDWLVQAYEKEQKEKKVLTPKERKEKRLKDKAKIIFCDAQPSIKDYSHLTEEEAERKLDRIRERDGWVEDDVYRGLMRIINGNYPIMEIPDDLSAEEPEKVLEWFHREKDENHSYFSKDVWKFICSVLKPYHEAELLQELATVDAADLEDWMYQKKSEGKFFSNKVYSKMRSMWLKQHGI